SVLSSGLTLSVVTYTSVYFDSEPWRFQWVFDAKPQSPEAALQTPPSPDYVLVPDHPPSPDYPLPADASPTTLSSGYIANLDLEEDPEEDPEDDPKEDPADYPVDKGDEEEEEFFRYDADDKEGEEVEASKEEDDNEEEEHLAPTDSFTVPINDPVPSAEDT
ncbi:hypothetical protein Tco_1262330, partial [Tanacetum coccineum]